jgi:glycosyltransferase involved in cell wall biosynthesis
MSVSALRVTMVNKYYSPPHLGGVETVVRHLSEGLVEHAGARVRALVCNEGRRPVAETVGGVDVVRLPRQVSLSSAPIALSLPAALHDEACGPEPADLINLHSPYPWGELSFLKARPDVPSVALYHSDIVRQKRLLAAYRPFLERFLDSVDLIAVSSPDMIEHSPFLAPRAEKCRLTHFGLPLERLAGAPGVLRRAAELRAAHSGRRIVLFAGRLVYYKGVDVLVRAMAAVDADLVLVGGGPMWPELRELAEACGTTERVAFLGTQCGDELAAWYQAADVFCLPSVARSEAFGLVQIEAHAAGTPVVSTRLTTGVPYANLDGVTGLTVPAGDPDALAAALNRLLADDDLRARLGRQAQARALSTFTIPHMVEQTLGVYAEALERHGKKRGGV